MYAHGLGHQSEVDLGQFPADLLRPAEKLPVSDSAECGIVEHDKEHRQSMLRRHGDFLAVHEHAAVTSEAYDRCIAAAAGSA